MWTFQFASKTDLEPAEIWPVLANLRDWPKIDNNIEYLELEGEPRAGAEFFLKPKGGPRLRFVIGDFEPPRCYSDVCTMPLARMTTRHILKEGEVVAEIAIDGPLAKVWGFLVGRKHAAGLPALTARMLSAASSGRGDHAPAPQ